MNYTIRVATIEDAFAISSVHDRSWRESYREIVPDDVIDGQTAESRLPKWQSFLLDPACITYVAEHDGDAVGIATFRPHDSELGFDSCLEILYVLRAAQRCGLGRRLVRTGARELYDRGYRSLMLHVIAGNANARAFYEALGAEYVRDLAMHEDGQAWTDAVYGWRNSQDLFET